MLVSMVRATRKIAAEQRILKRTKRRLIKYRCYVREVDLRVTVGFSAGGGDGNCAVADGDGYFTRVLAGGGTGREGSCQ